MLYNHDYDKQVMKGLRIVQGPNILFIYKTDCEHSYLGERCGGRKVKGGVGWGRAMVAWKAVRVGDLQGHIVTVELNNHLHNNQTSNVKKVMFILGISRGRKKLRVLLTLGTIELCVRQLFFL
jgi:hypothetical protein